MNTIRRFLLALILMPALACAPRVSGPGPVVRGRPHTAYALRWVDVVTGTGASAVPGKKITVHYTGWLHDGTKFDSSRDRNEPFTFLLGAKQVIIGWDTGFDGMRVGGHRRLIIPYQLAYGAKQRGKLPPNSELTFDMELLAVSDSGATSAAPQK